MRKISISHTDTTLFPSVLHRITLLSALNTFYRFILFPAWIWSREGVSMVIVVPWFIIGKHAIKLMKTYAAVNIWLAFIYVPNPFQLNPHWSLRERVRAVINCLYMQLIKGLNWIQGKHCFVARENQTGHFYLFTTLGLNAVENSTVSIQSLSGAYVAVPIDLSPLF